MNIRAGICLLALISSLPFLAPVQAAEEGGSCSGHVAQWLDPASGEKLDGQQLLQRLAKTRVVLLGEAHTSVAHHRWQHYMLAALHAYNPNMMVGFEMLPRAAQPVLDEWSAGRLGEKDCWSRHNGKKSGVTMQICICRCCISPGSIACPRWP
ncbi:MAG: hypothetical protein EP300_01005 [Gammaproteobacteria bacterium]|nr:MAG: hypothetical protein EP300_01005 [Gammaproteobacteria bacterium]